MSRLTGLAGWGGIFLFFFLISACGEVSGNGQCGGVADGGSCIRIESITPSYLDNDTSNVDAFQDVCEVDDTTGDPTEFEVFTDHSAAIQISNLPFPGAPEDTVEIVTLRDFSVEYFVNRCPTGGTCPALTPLVASEQVTVQPNGTTEYTLPFVPLATKFEYVALSGSPNTFPSYTVLYTITGTTSFGKAVSVQGTAEFTIGNFDNCS